MGKNLCKNLFTTSINELPPEIFAKFIRGLPGIKPIAVFGDVGLDHYIYGDVNRISPEAPTMVVDAQNAKDMLGLAANVCVNLKTLGTRVKLFSIIGKDLTSRKFKQLLDLHNIDNTILTDPSRVTTKKTRVIGGNQHICRIDNEDRHDMNPVLQNNLLVKFLKELDNYGAIIIQDYNKGLLTADYIGLLITYARSRRIPVFIDPHPSKDPRVYSGADYLKPNIKEARALCLKNYLFKSTQEYSPEELCNYLQKITSIPNILLTMGSDGIYVNNTRTSTYLPALSSEAVDVSGAGDTVIAMTCAGILTRLSFSQSAQLGNLAAKVVIAKKGTASLTLDELESVYKKLGEK